MVVTEPRVGGSSKFFSKFFKTGSAAGSAGTGHQGHMSPRPSVSSVTRSRTCTPAAQVISSQVISSAGIDVLHLQYSVGADNSDDSSDGLFSLRSAPDTALHTGKNSSWCPEVSSAGSPGHGGSTGHGKSRFRKLFDPVRRTHSDANGKDVPAYALALRHDTGSQSLKVSSKMIVQ